MSNNNSDPFKYVIPDIMLFDYIYYKDSTNTYRMSIGDIARIQGGYLFAMFPWDSAIPACESILSGEYERTPTLCRSYKFKMIDYDEVSCVECGDEFDISTTIWIVE